MCWHCDHPDQTLDDYLDLVRRTIDQYGWFVQYVEPDRHHPPMAYTVGLTRFGLAELLVTGLAQHVAGGLLNGVAHQLVHHDEPPYVAGDLQPVEDALLEVVDLPVPSAHVVTAINVYGDGVRAQQLVWTDDRGHWPWEVGFRGRQPVLGPRHLCV